MTYAKAARTTSRQTSKSTQSKYKNVTTKPFEITSEHDLQKACVAKLRGHNMICSCTDVFNSISFMKDIRSKAIYKQHMIRMGGAVGFPDLIIIHNGECTFVEFKWKKGKKSPEQVLWTEILQKQGYEVLEWRTLEQCEEWITQHLNNKEKLDADL